MKYRTSFLKVGQGDLILKMHCKKSEEITDLIYIRIHSVTQNFRVKKNTVRIRSK